MKKGTIFFIVVYGILLLAGLFLSWPFWLSLLLIVTILAIWKLLQGLAWHNTYFLFFIAFLSLALASIANKTTGLLIFLLLYSTFISQINKKDYPAFTYQVRLKIFFWFLSFSWFFLIYSFSQYLPFSLSLLLLISGFRLLLQIANNETACLGDNLLQDLVYLFVIIQFAWLAVLLPLNPFGQAFFLVIWGLYFNERFKGEIVEQSVRNIISQTILIGLISLGTLLLK
jgi:hypothetical protein